MEMDFSNKSLKSSFSLPYEIKTRANTQRVNVAKVGGAKPSSTTSKINHALEILKKYDNKYRIKSAAGLETNHKEVDILNSNSSRVFSLKSDKSENVEDLDLVLSEREIDVLHRPTTITTKSTSVDTSKSNDKIIDSLIKTSNFTGVLLTSVNEDLAQARAENEDYESDFESSDSEPSLGDSLYDNGDDHSVKESSGMGMHNKTISDSEVESSSIHTVFDHDAKPSSIENVGLFSDIKVFAFSDIELKQPVDSGKHVNQNMFSQQLDNTLSPLLLSKSKSATNHTDEKVRSKEVKSFNPSLNEHHTYLKHDGNMIKEVPNLNTLRMPSSDDSISEVLLSKQDESKDSTPSHFQNLLALEELEDNISNQSKAAPALAQKSKTLDMKGMNTTTSNEMGSRVCNNLLTSHSFEEEIEEKLDYSQDSDDLKEERDGYFSENVGYNSEQSVSERSKKESGSMSESPKTSKESKNSVLSGTSNENHERNQSDSEKQDCTNTSVVTEEQKNAIKGHLLHTDTKRTTDLEKQQQTQDTGVQTHSHVYEHQSSKNKSRYRERRSKPRPSHPVIQPLKMSWTFEEAENSKPGIIFQDLALSPEVLEVLSKNMVAEDALNQVVRQQVSLTRHFMASQYKMYQSYCETVGQLTRQYRPVTLEETKEFIRRNKKTRPSVHNEEVY